MDQCQLYQEVLGLLGFKGDEIEGLCFKDQCHSIQSGIRKYGDKEKKLVMKEMRNLAITNKCFGELEHNSLMQEMKERALLLLMFIMMKRS